MINYEKIKERANEIKLAEIEEIQKAQYGETEKNESINSKVRASYSVNDELGVHRKVIQAILEHIGITNEEFAILCQSIAQAKYDTEEEIAMRDSSK